MLPRRRRRRRRTDFGYLCTRRSRLDSRCTDIDWHAQLPMVTATSGTRIARAARRADGVISGRFELHPAWNLSHGAPRLRQLSRERGPYVAALVPQDTKEAVMGLRKKAKHEAKAVKGKTKKDAGKVKHKGKKAKNAAKH